MSELAIIGLGSWGLCVLERSLSRARATGVSATVHVVQPGPPGGGVYAADQPDYLVLNNACGQLSLYASPEPDHQPAYALGLHEWTVKQGYTWHGHECRKAPGGRPIQPGDYLPRRIMGEYLSWFYETLVASAPANLHIVRHDTAATDIVPEVGGKERVTLADGTAIVVDHVVLTSGHTWNAEPEIREDAVRYHRPYPVEYFDEILPPGAGVAVAGMGLVGFDMLAAMTIGRGGDFEPDGARLHYRPSGREPVIFFYSRGGMPTCAKSATGVDSTGLYQPVICTQDVFERLTGQARGGRRRVDFRADLLPLLFAEMQARYHTQAAMLDGGQAAADEVSASVGRAWAEGHFEKTLAELERRHGRFVPEDHLFAGAGRKFMSSRDYETFVYDMVADDLDEALMPGGSPVKAAQEVLRILRDQLRSVIEFGGLSLDSYSDFQSNIRGRINRMEAGPPPLRSQQLLALMDAGVVRIPFGPSPTVEAVPGGGITIRSTQLDEPYTAHVTAVIRGHLDLPSLPRSASPLLRRLYDKGRLTQLHYGETPVGSVAISEDFHPYDVEGRLQQHLSLLGVLTEGVRYFTHYLPSPRSRLRAVQDAQACVEAVLG